MASSKFTKAGSIHHLENIFYYAYELQLWQVFPSPFKNITMTYSLFSHADNHLGPFPSLGGISSTIVSQNIHSAPSARNGLIMQAIWDGLLPQVRDGSWGVNVSLVNLNLGVAMKHFCFTIESRTHWPFGNNLKLSLVTNVSLSFQWISSSIGGIFG